MEFNVYDLYVCPKCKGRLQQQSGMLHCNKCGLKYPLYQSIVDFLLVKPQENSNPFLHGFGKLLAPIYESSLWFPIMLKLLGGWDAPSLKTIIKNVQDKMSHVKGFVLDVATGTATYGRHIAGDDRTVYGIDISMEMLLKGRDYAIREGVKNIHFSRGDGYSLPFGNEVFDACTFCGSLHIFPDTLRVLKEVSRTLKSGAPVVVTTLIHGEKGIVKRSASRPHMKIFDTPDLKNIIDDAGFDHFEPQSYGCLLMFTMQKR